MADPSFAVHPIEEGNGLRLVGELDMATVPELEAALSTATAPVVLDLAELSFIDSAGLHALVRYARALNGNGPLVLKNMPAQVRRVFELMKLDQHPVLALGDGALGS
jgi:anti-anti-sigma factor